MQALESWIMEDQQPVLSRQQGCYNSITVFLDQNEIEYKTVHHEVTPTSEDAARVRGVPLSMGGKSLRRGFYISRCRSGL